MDNNAGLSHFNSSINQNGGWHKLQVFFKPTPEPCNMSEVSSNQLRKDQHRPMNLNFWTPGMTVPFYVIVHCTNSPCDVCDFVNTSTIFSFNNFTFFFKPRLKNSTLVIFRFGSKLVFTPLHCYG